jgi:hypothetical protein
VEGLTCGAKSELIPLDDQCPLIVFVRGQPHPVYEITPEFAMSLGATHKYDAEPGVTPDYYVRPPGPNPFSYSFSFAFVNDRITRFNFDVDSQKPRDERITRFNFGVDPQKPRDDASAIYTFSVNGPVP